MPAKYADSPYRPGMEALMAVKRIVPNIASDQLDKAKSFYAEMLDMDVVMDLGWIVMFAAASNANPQVSVATEGGSGTSVPDLSVEVDNFDEVLLRLRRSGLPSNMDPCGNLGASSDSSSGIRLADYSISSRMNSLVPTTAAPTRNGYVSVGAVYLSRGNRISDIRCFASVPDFAFALSLHRRPQIDQGGAKPERATHCMKFAPSLNQAACLGVRGSRRRRLQALVDRKNDPERIGPVGEDQHRAQEPTPIPGINIDQHA